MSELIDEEKNMKHLPSQPTDLGTLNNRGLTLVELMVALAIAAIVLTSVSTAFVSQQRTATSQDQVAEMQQNIRAGLNIMERDIRMAGYDPRHSVGAGILTANATQLRISLVADTDLDDNDNDGTTDEVNELAIIEYRLYDAPVIDGDLDLGRQPLPAAIQPAVENIDAVEFYYTLADGTQTLAPTPAQLGDIRAVQVSILARSGRPDPDFTNTATYTPASGNAWDINGAADGSGNPVNDNFRRRLLITTIQCRNMGL